MEYNDRFQAFQRKNTVIDHNPVAMLLFPRIIIAIFQIETSKKQIKDES